MYSGMQQLLPLSAFRLNLKVYRRMLDWLFLTEGADTREQIPWEWGFFGTPLGRHLAVYSRDSNRHQGGRR